MPLVVVDRWVTAGGLLALAFLPSASDAQRPGERRDARDVRATSSVGGPRPRYPNGVRLCAGGDVTLGSNLDPKWARAAAQKLRAEYGLSAEPTALLAPLRPLVADADVVLLNVEGAIGQGPVAERKCSPNSTNCYAFRQPVSAARALRDLAPEAIIVGNVANNHSRDAGGAGFVQTARHLRRAGVRVTGADSLATRVVTLAGDTLAALGFHTTEDGLIPDARDLDAVYRHVARAVQRYGTVVVTMHLGAEGINAQRTRNETEIFLGRIDRGNPVAFADTVFAAGATLIIGHGPHVLRAGEWRDDRLVLYSLGNLLTYGPFNNKEPTNRGAVACVTIDSARHVSEAELRSTVQPAPGVLSADPSERAVVIVDSLSALDFPRTGVRVFPGGVIGRRDIVGVGSSGTAAGRRRRSGGNGAAEGRRR
ncbi:MAG: CapA family protein [Gemmatimonadota bacterium]|nr:CapA family protein [Gemmatimonadota bacterium]